MNIAQHQWRLVWPTHRAYMLLYVCHHCHRQHGSYPDVGPNPYGSVRKRGVQIVLYCMGCVMGLMWCVSRGMETSCAFAASTTASAVCHERQVNMGAMRAFELAAVGKFIHGLIKHSSMLHFYSTNLSAVHKLQFVCWVQPALACLLGLSVMSLRLQQARRHTGSY